MSIPGKIYGRILINRVADEIRGHVVEEQEDFRPGKDFVDWIFLLIKKFRVSI